MCQFRALIKKCGLNDPTPSIVYVIPVGDVTTLPAATTTPTTGPYNTITTDPTLVAAKKWQKVLGRRSSVKYTDVVKGEYDANQQREQKLVLFYPESDAETFYNASISLGSDVLVGWTNGNGHKMIWGTLDNPVTVTKFDFDSSKGGFDIEFMREAGGAELPAFYTGAFTV
jgi:hypothetical protein